MGSEIWWSIGVGAGIGAVYGGAAFLTHRLALRFQDNRFTAVVLGGMLLRMFLLLAVVALVVALVPIHAAAFLIALVAVLLLSLAIELTAMLRRIRATQQSS